jgi:ribosome maturation factor RimP
VAADLNQDIKKEEDHRIEDIWSLLEPVVASEGLEILEIEYRRESIGWVLRIYIDNEKGVSVDDCAGISRIVGDVLDVADLIPSSYHLEVSSPGIDRPLRRWEHFRKYTGDIVEIRTTSPLQNRRNFKGLLTEASSEQIVIESEGKSHTIPLLFIERARLLYFESTNRKSQHPTVKGKF